VFEFMNQIDGPHFAGLCSVTGIDPKNILPAAPEQTEAVEDAHGDEATREEV